jgi:hypothetical protein
MNGVFLNSENFPTFSKHLAISSRVIVEFLEKYEHRSAKSSFQFRLIKQAKAITRRNHYFRGT